MTEPTEPQPWPAAAAASARRPEGSSGEQLDAVGRFSALTGLPVPEHVALFEAEHERLVHELRAVDEF